MKASAARRLFRAVLLSVATALVTTASMFVAAYLLFPLNGIQVSGARMYPESGVENFVSEHSSLLTLNTRKMEQEIEANPWVKVARVRKEWESGIVSVEVEERRPILYGEIEGREVVLSGDGRELPGLGGVDLNKVELDRDQVPEILNVARTFEKYGVNFGSVEEVGPGGVEATVEGRPVVFSGDVGPGQARALEGVMERHPEAPVFDLRSPERVVVGAGDGGDGESEG